MPFSSNLNRQADNTTMPGLTSASGVLGFLYDEEPELKVFALQTLNDDIDTLWTEVAGAVGQMYVNAALTVYCYCSCSTLCSA